MTNREALHMAISNIIKDAPDADLSSKTIEFLGWLEAEFKPKSIFELIPTLSMEDLASEILDIIDLIGPVNPETSLDEAKEIIINCLISEPFNSQSQPEPQPGDIILNGAWEFVMLGGNLCLNTSTNEKVPYSVIKDSIKRIARNAPGELEIKTIWKR